VRWPRWPRSRRPGGCDHAEGARPAALDAYAGLGLAGTDTLELLAKAPDQESAARLTASQVTAALRRAGRRGDLAQRAGHPGRAARDRRPPCPGSLRAERVPREPRAYYDDLRACDIGHNDALSRVASRLTGILHGCVKTGTGYDEATAWSHRFASEQAA
jgi:hypothetical protein